MEDRVLLEYYLSLRDREAYQWNLSPRSLYVELETRDFLHRHYKPTVGSKVCNVGIGVGEWDDFLGYYLEGKGQLTSIDIDSEICDVFKLRQKKEGHSNPSEVICGDFLRSNEQACGFDLLTIIGSTMHQVGKSQQLLARAHKALKDDGLLYLMNFEKYLSKEQALHALQAAGFFVKTVEEHHRYPGMDFYNVGAIKR
ncbi:class I SAM-dependent methyltransferase [Paenibacillus daejeonensis]|uniref:class I SAM-dependent methyltransferase n=1 Tax=Paenibacillus daejeonensis TaxID=135193 RepID=UPI000373E6D2|nr:class I SAM-dependent methyltransferase [Paenibacillus daejeonensis]